jgi:hypothetical protein
MFHRMPARTFGKIKAVRSKVELEVMHLRIYDPSVARFIRREADKNMRSVPQQIVFMLKGTVPGSED